MAAIVIACSGVMSMSTRRDVPCTRSPSVPVAMPLMPIASSAVPMLAMSVDACDFARRLRGLRSFEATEHGDDRDERDHTDEDPQRACDPPRRGAAVRLREAERVEQRDREQHGAQVPEEDRHDHAVAGDDDRPRLLALQPARDRGAEEHDERDLQDRQRDQADRRRRHVRDSLAGEADHAVRVRPERRERDESEQRRGRSAGELRACELGERAVGVEEAELLREEPHEQDVQPSDRRVRRTRSARCRSRPRVRRARLVSGSGSARAGRASAERARRPSDTRRRTRAVGTRPSSRRRAVRGRRRT